jgi:ADP-heptose:LPS heptosyltransferase
MAARGRESNAFFHLSHSCEVELALMEGQTAFWWSDKARRRICDHSYLGYVHDICDMPWNFSPEFFPTEAEMIQAWDTLGRIRTARPGPVIGWGLCGSRLDKLYPYSAFLIARMIVELGASVVMFGSPLAKEQEMSRTIHEHVKIQNGSDAGLHEAISHNPDDPEWPIRRALTQARLCDLFISPDTGSAWSVAMLPMPKIILLSHASARNITHGWVNTTSLHADQGRVPCWPCHRLHDVWDTCHKAKDLEAAACMADISAEAIMRAARRAITPRS